MAKKKRRSTSTTTPRRQATKSEIPNVDPLEMAAPPKPAAPAPRPAPKLTRQQAATERLEDEYAYVIRDLRRVFILAAIMFGLLIALNLLLGRLPI